MQDDHVQIFDALHIVAVDGQALVAHPGQFAAPEAWGSGIRAGKLRGEPEFQHPPSDGHMTGMALVALREAGVPTADPRIQRGVTWLLKNQRVSGRWWTRSLNTDGRHFITYSGTAFPVLALSLCDALPIDAARRGD